MRKRAARIPIEEEGKKQGQAKVLIKWLGTAQIFERGREFTIGVSTGTIVHKIRRGR